MENTKHQIFRNSIALPNIRLSHRDAFEAVENVINQLNDNLQHQIKAGGFVEHSNPELGGASVWYKDAIIVGMELRFQRDTGKFNGCTGEIMGAHEDRYHSLILDVEFIP